MRTQLYDHNRTAYKKVMAALETSDRTCVVHPTGTGKSFLIAAVSESYKRVLILGPNIFVLDQVHQVLKWRKRGVEYMTYKALMLTENPHTDYDLICLDEFHRAGAPEWGDAVDRLLEANPQAKVLGTTATHIRYLDNERNMADELFDGNVASQITIAEAWSRNILPIPRYVSGLFRWDKVVADVTDRINRSRSLTIEEKRKRIFRLNNARLHWELSYGMVTILKKHLDRDARRVIIFCAHIEALEQMRQEVIGWFREAGFTIAGTCIMHSCLSDREQREQMERFEDDTDGKGVKLMFSVNMLNEGIHVPNVNAVLMLRTTSSRIIYMQQMGRCLTAANTAKPLVLDMVDNITTTTTIKGLRDEFNLLELQKAEHEACEPRKFEVVDYMVSVKDLINKLSQHDYALIPFEERIRMVTAYVEQHGRIPGKKDDRRERHNWCQLTRRYGDRPEVAALVKKYNRVISFEERLKRAKDFCAQHGRVPGKKDISAEYLNWLQLSRKYGDRPGVQALKEQYKRFVSFEERLQRLMAYVDKHDMPPGRRSDRQERNNWVILMSAYKDRPEVKELVRRVSGRVSFGDRLKRATAFCEKNGRLPRKAEWHEYLNWARLRLFKDRPEVIALKEHYQRHKL